MEVEVKRKLYLIPSTLGDSDIDKVIPVYNRGIILGITHFVAEEEKTVRRFLIRCGYQNIQKAVFYLLNEHTPARDIPFIFSDSGSSDLGLISEAGLPGVADPGNMLVSEAFRLGMKVIPLSGPSSLMLAMMASGLNGQQFAFNGYLPQKPNERSAKIRYFEKRSLSENQSQLFIEAPYRNNHLVDSLLATLRHETRLCIAVNLTLENEWICTRTVGEWIKQPPGDLKKQPAVFIFLA